MGGQLPKGGRFWSAAVLPSPKRAAAALWTCSEVIPVQDLDGPREVVLRQLPQPVRPVGHERPPGRRRGGCRGVARPSAPGRGGPPGAAVGGGRPGRVVRPNPSQPTSRRPTGSAGTCESRRQREAKRIGIENERQQAGPGVLPAPRPVAFLPEKGTQMNATPTAPARQRKPRPRLARSQGRSIIQGAAVPATQGLRWGVRRGAPWPLPGSRPPLPPAGGPRRCAGPPAGVRLAGFPRPQRDHVVIGLHERHQPQQHEQLDAAAEAGGVEADVLDEEVQPFVVGEERALLDVVVEVQAGVLQGGKLADVEGVDAALAPR